MTAPIRVLLVEDNETFRQTLELLLGLRSEIDVVGSVANGYDAAAAAASLAPDVVLMDYRMPGLDGAHATRAVLAAAPSVRVVCLTASVSADEERQMIEAGAVSCVTKESELDAIVTAIEDALVVRG